MAPSGSSTTARRSRASVRASEYVRSARRITGARRSTAAPRHAEESPRRHLAQADDGCGRRQSLRADLGAVALPVAAREAVVAEQHAPAGVVTDVATVALQGERA